MFAFRKKACYNNLNLYCAPARKGFHMINIAILGFGVVGSGAAEVLADNAALLRANTGHELRVSRILDLRDFPDSPFAALVTHDFADILSDPTISIVAETMGGAHPAYDFTKAALEAGKNVVTSNKEVVATFGTELLEIAAAHGVRYLFEASVGGGIPIIRPMVNDLASNRIDRIDGILNGTTNYILTRMIGAGASFADALREAQKKGYAEANPSADVDGLDAARKIVILAALAFGPLLSPAGIHCEGISALTPGDVASAAAFGCSLKLIGHAERQNGRVLAMVSPRMVPLSHPLSGISDVFNGILVDANMVGEVMFYGRGAGKLPTASAVVADMIDIVTHEGKEVRAPHFTAAAESDYADFEESVCVSCFSFEGTAADTPRVTAVFGNAPIKVLSGRISVLGAPMSEHAAAAAAAAVGLPLLSRIRML